MTTCAVVLAAGRSRRMGAQKLLLPFAGATVIEHVVDQLLRAPLSEVCVVVGDPGAGIAEALSGRALRIVTNPDPQADMLSSVRCGLQALPPACGAIMLALGDQPGITSELIDAMVRSFGTSGKGILVPVYRGKRGHPLLFAARYAPEIMARYDGVGLCGLLHAHPEDILELEVPTSAVLSDMNYPEDYRRELARLAENCDRARPPL